MNQLHGISQREFWDSYKKGFFGSYKIFSCCKSKNKNIVTPESPTEADSWVVDFYGSKSGIRQLSQMQGGLSGLLGGGS